MAPRALILSFALIVTLGSSGCTRTDPKGGTKPVSQSASSAEGSPPRPGSDLNQSATEKGSQVTLLRVPNGGLQPQAVADAGGTLHLIYFKGKPGAGDLFYVSREAGKEGFSTPLRVNSQPGSACAVGSVRGGQMALGKNGRVHAVWVNTAADGFAYARLNDAGTAFEKQRDRMGGTSVIDGGSTVAADRAGNVYVAWHALKKGDSPGEKNRRVWVARSGDDGKTFAKEAPAWAETTGVCPCCSTRALAEESGSLHLLYRSATDGVNRDIYTLASTDKGKSFRGALVHKWKVPG